MNPAQLLAHFDRLADQPDAIPRLRQLILDLAVRGKLVEQDPNDEPAAGLLARIREEKARWVREGMVKAQAKRPDAVEEAPPFTIPLGWQWSQLAEIGFLSPSNQLDDETLASFVPMPLISTEYGVPNQHEPRRWGDIKKGYTHFAEGDVVLAKITPCFENGKSTVLRGLTSGAGSGTTELHVVRPVLLLPDYILVFLKCPHFIESGIPRMTGTAGQKRVPRDYFAYAPFPLPPLAEQQRIVAKVDELMALCDQLEAAQTQRESARDQLAATALHRLGQPAEPAASREHASFYLRHLPRLAVRPEQITAIRQTILTLAVQGKLVPQDPNDEPAEAYLARVQRERDVATNGGDPSRWGPEDALCGLPASWTWARAQTVCETVVDCPHSTPVFVGTGVVCLDTNCFKQGKLVPGKVRYVSKETYQERIKRLSPAAGDIVFAREGSVGESVVIPEGMECCLGQRVMLFRPLPGISSSYIQLAVSEPSSLARLLLLHKGIGARHVNVGDMRNALVPLPPLAEQQRIVAKVDELMALCDQLEAELATTRTARHDLLESVLHEALAVGV